MAMTESLERQKTGTVSFPDLPGKRQTGPGAKKDRILDAAGRLFAENGYAKTTVDEIASLAGISKGLVYVHFPSKEEILAQVLWNAGTEWLALGRVAVEENPGSVCQAIGQWYRSSFHYARSHPILCSILAQDSGLNLPGDEDVLRPLLQAYTDLLEELLQKGLEQGELHRDLDARKAAESIRILIQGLICEVFLAPDRPDEEIEELLEASIQLTVSGIRPLG